MLTGRTLIIVVSFAVVAAIGSAVWIIDSPSLVRAQRMDELRVRDLDLLATKIDCYWTLESRLPENEEALVARTTSVVGQGEPSSTCRSQLPKDPETGERYAYRVLEESLFELCAQFAAPKPDNGLAARYSWRSRKRDWNHGIGRTCFRLTPVRVEKL